MPGCFVVQAVCDNSVHSVSSAEMLYIDGCFFTRLADMLPEVVNKSRHYLFVVILFRYWLQNALRPFEQIQPYISATDKNGET